MKKKKNKNTGVILGVVLWKNIWQPYVPGFYFGSNPSIQVDLFNFTFSISPNSPKFLSL